MKKKRLLPLGILAILILAALIYTRPMTLEAMFGLDITQSEAVHAYSHTVFAEENQTPSVENAVWPRGEERTEELIELLSQQRFRRSLRNLLPWEETGYAPKNNLLLDAIFSFSDRQDCLYFESYFGRLNLSSTSSKSILCTTSNQEEFLQQVYDILSSDAP